MKKKNYLATIFGTQFCYRFGSEVIVILQVKLFKMLLYFKR